MNSNNDRNKTETTTNDRTPDRRSILLGGTALVAASAIASRTRDADISNLDHLHGGGPSSSRWPCC
jgi:hypothetical protein